MVAISIGEGKASLFHANASKQLCGNAGRIKQRAASAFISQRSHGSVSNVVVRKELALNWRDCQTPTGPAGRRGGKWERVR